MNPEEQDQLDLEKAQQAKRAQEQGDRVVIDAAPLPPDPAIGGVRGALTLTEDDNADNEKIINRLAVLGGQPKAILRALEPTELQRMAREQGVLFGTENTPTLRQQYTNPDFARSASDDVKALAEIEKQMLAAREKLAPKVAPRAQFPTQKMGGGYGDLPSGLFPSKPMGFKDVTREKAGMELLNPLDLGRSASAGVIGDTIVAGGGIIQSGAELTDEFFRSPVSPALAYLTDGNVRGEVPKDPNAVLPRVAEWAKGARQLGTEVGDFIAPEETGNFILDAINSGARSAGQSMVWVAAAAVTGQPEIAVGGLTAVTYGQKYGEYRDAGVSPFEAALGAGAQAGLENITEKLPFHVLVGDITNKTPFGQMMLKQLFAENATEQVATFTQDMVDWAVLNPEKTVGEFLAERPSAALQTAIATTVATLLQTTVAKGADAAAGHFLRGEDEANQNTEIANAGREAMKALLSAAAESKTRERDPEQFRDFVDKLAQEGNVKAAYFSPEAFTRVAQAMGKTPDELATVFGVDGQVQAALASGAKIEVPLSVFLEKVGGMENGAAILKETAHSPFHLSEVEEAEVPDATKQRLVAEADKVAQAAVSDAEFAQGVETIRTNIEQQLNQTGRFVGTPNRLYAQLTAVFYGNIARQLGITPAEALARRPLTVTGERITGKVTQVEDTLPQEQEEEGFPQKSELRGDRGAVDVFKADGFRILDETPEITMGDLSRELGVSLGQADRIRKSWKQSRGIGTHQREVGRPKGYAQNKFEAVADIAVDNLLELPENEWNDVIRRTKYAIYNLPPGVTDLELPKGYVVLQSSGGNYAVREDHLKARQKTGEKFARLGQNGRNSGYYVPSKSTIILMARADLSTFIHELGHHFLEMRFDIAKQLKADADAGRALAPGEQELLDDVRAWFRQAGIKPGNPGEGNALPQDVAWGLYFFDNILIDPTEADLKAFKMKMATAGKPFTIRLFKTTNGRIVAFPGEYSHDDARTLLAANEKPGAEFKMRHAMWDGGSLRFQSWYDTTGTLDDDGGTFAQDVIASLKQIGQLTPEDRAQWYDDEVEEQLRPRANGHPGRKLSFRSEPGLPYPDCDIFLIPTVNAEGHRGVTADLLLNGMAGRGRDEKGNVTKVTPEDLVKAHQVFARAIVALQAYAERHRPDYIAFTPVTSRTESRTKLYDALLRRYHFGYEARITSTINITATESSTTKGVAKRFLLVRPDIARDVPLELSNAELSDGEWFGEPSVEKQRVITEIVQSGRSAPVDNTVDTGGPGTGGSDVAGTYAQSQAKPRPAWPIDDDTLDRASKELNGTQFEAWKLARAGKTNEEIAIIMGGEDATVEPSQVATWIFDAKGHGYPVEKQPRGLTLSGQTLHVIALSARGVGPTEIAEEVYPDRPKADAVNQVKQLRFRHKGLIEQWQARKTAGFAQSAARLQKKPPTIVGTGPGGRVLNRDLGKFLTDRHMKKYGRALNPEDPADYKIILKSMVEDYENQSQETDTGDAWYTDDINEAVRVTSAIYPDLADDPEFRDLFLTVAALLSPQQKPTANWDNAILALRSWKATGRLELLKPSGKMYGVLSHTNGLKMLQHLVDTLGLEKATAWVQEEHTGREMAEMRMASGIFAPIDKDTGKVSTKVKDYLPSETNLTESKLGIYAFGPKVGDFMQNSTGIDQSAVTVDLWAARTYNRYLGRLLDTADGDIASDVRGRGEREHIKRLVRDAAAKVGIDPSAMQAALWYFEQRLFRNLGVKADSQNFSGAARAALSKRGLDVPVAESDQRVASQDAGQGASGRTGQKGQVDDGYAQGPIFYSALKRAAEGAKQTKASATDWKAILKKAEGVKAEEIEAVGLFDYLDMLTERGEKQIAREDVVNFLDQNGVRVVDVLLGPPAQGPRGRPIPEPGSLADLQDQDQGVQDRVDYDRLVSEHSEDIGAAYDDLVSAHFYEAKEVYLESNPQAAAIFDEALALEKKRAEDDGEEYDEDLARDNIWTGEEDTAYDSIRDLFEADPANAEELAGLRLTATATVFRRIGKLELFDRVNSDFDAPRGWAVAETGPKYPDTRWERYTLVKGEQYRELLLTLDSNKGTPFSNAASQRHWGDLKNILAHIRFSIVGDTVVIDEMQSDWHQAGRDNGYREPRAFAAAQAAKTAALNAYHDALRAASRELATTPEAGEALYDDYSASYDTMRVMHDMWISTFSSKDNVLGANPDKVARFQEIGVELGLLRQRYVSAAAEVTVQEVSGVPDAPYKDSAWAALALKRMIRWAAENGYKEIAWTPGDVHAERWNMHAVVDKLELAPLKDEATYGKNEWSLVGWKNGSVQIQKRTVSDTELDELLGKALAKQLKEAPVGQASGGPLDRMEGVRIHNIAEDDVMVGPGKGMRFFYDTRLVNEANKLGKKYGAQVGEKVFEHHGKVRPAGHGGVRSLPVRYENGAIASGTENQATAYHVLPITDEMAAAALEGAPLFQPEQDGPPGGNPLTPEEKAFFARAMRELPPGSDEIDIWDAMSLAERTPYHELFARQFEAFAFEGKAPSTGLKRMFENFRTYMLDVYRSLVNLNAPLTDEVRGIMSRMLASREEIANAHKINTLSALFTVQPEKMTDQEWEDYLRTNEQATQDAESTLAQRSLRDTKWLSNARSREMRRLQAEANEQRKAMGAEVAAEVMAEPVNVARKFLSKGIGKDGKPVEEMLAGFNDEGQLVTGKPKLSIGALKAMFPEGSGIDWQKLGYGKWGMLAEDGMHPDAIARLLGYESGDALVRELVTAEPASAKIKGVTEQRMLERYGDLTDEASIARAADEAVYSPMRGKILAAEYAALTAALGEKKLLNEAARQAAATIVRRLVASKLSVKTFLAAERRAGRAAEDAFRKNDLAGAAAAKKDQLLSFYLVKEVMEKQKEYDKTKLKFKQIIEAKKDSVSKSRNFDLVQASRAILAAYGMAQMRQKPMDYMNAIKTYDPTLYAALEPTLLNAMTTRQTLAQLTVEQFFGVRDVVVQLWDLSREEKLVEINGKKVELKVVTDELNLHMEALGADPNKPITEAPSPAQRTLRMLEGAAASLRRVESWARMMDKGVAGPFTKFLWRPISQAATRYRQDQTKYILKFRELFAPIEKALTDARVAAPELGYTFRNKAELLHAILHTGNASNLRKLLLGYRWAQDRADGTLDTSRWDAFLARMAHEGTLTVKDYQFAQTVWDLLEETKPLAQEAHRRVFGRYFAEITADEVRTPFGSFKGGYVPAIYDDFHNTDVALKRGQDAIEGNDSTMFPAPTKGFTEARVEYNRPMQLDVRLLASHLDKVLKFAHMAAPVRDVLRILRSPGVERHLHDLHPTATEDMLLPWLVRSARQTNEAPIGGKAGRAVTAFANGLRRRSNMGLMFANVVNVLQQPTGLLNAAAFKGVKKRYLGQAMARYLRNPAGIHAAVRALSPLIETRSASQAIAMRDTLDTIVSPKGKFEQAAAWFERHTYFAQTALQNQQDVVVWLAAFESSKSRGETEAEAAQYADAVIRQTQGSATPEDISRFETGTGWQKILTSMYGYFNMWGNHLSTEFRQSVRDQGLKKSSGRLLYVYFIGFMAPALLAQLIADAIRGDLPDDEEDEGLQEWLSRFFGTQAKTAAAMVPIVGASVIAGVNAFNEKPYDDRVLSSPAISALETVVRVPKDFVDYIGGDGDASRTAKDTLSLLTLLTGLPFQALARPLGYALDVAEGDVEPEDGVDYARGLVAGR